MDGDRLPLPAVVRGVARVLRHVGVHREAVDGGVLEVAVLAGENVPEELPAARRRDHILVDRPIAVRHKPAAPDARRVADRFFHGCLLLSEGSEMNNRRLEWFRAAADHDYTSGRQMRFASSRKALSSALSGD